MRFDRLVDQLIGVLALAILAGGTLIVIAPFVTTLLWGAILAYCTWHPFEKLVTLLRGRRMQATLFEIVLILGLLLAAVFYIGAAVSARLPDLVVALQERLARDLPPLPDWLSQTPLIGPRIDALWKGIADRNPEVIARLRELAGPMLRASIGIGLGVIQGLGLLALSVLFAGVFYMTGERSAAAIRVAMQRVAGARADALLALIGNTVKGVVYGVLGTSLMQALLCAIGYWIAGLPSVALLGFATFFLAIIPGGPLLIVVPGAIWLAQSGNGSWAAFLVVWCAAVSIAIDNILKPAMIGKSSHVPFVLVMIGVIGGAAAFGLLGVFIGPTLLATAHAVFRDWTAISLVNQPQVQHEAAPHVAPG